MIVVLVETDHLAPGTRIGVPPEEAHHLKVRRAQPGDPVRLLDGRGTVAEGVLVAGESVDVTAVRQAPPPAPLVLAVGAGDRERFGWLVEKAAELGVTDVIPLETERTAGVSTRVRGAHVERLQRRAAQAIKQSGAAWAPTVHVPGTLAEVMGRHPSGTRWLADREGGRPTLAAGDADPVLAVVGPEGGWSGAERELLVAGGFAPVRLGSYTLRFETAAIAAAVAAGMLREGDLHG